MSFIDTLKAFFRTRKVDPAAIAVGDAFMAANAACKAPLDAIDAYTNRANHCHAILAARAVHKAAPDDPAAAAAYDEAIAGYTGPGDFDPYTEAYLDAHTAAIDILTAAFDTLTVVFDALTAAFNPADDFYASAAALYKIDCDLYTVAADAYSNAAYCAMITALEGELQTVKDDVEVLLLKLRANNAAAADAVIAKAKAAALKAKAAEDASKAKQLEQKARIAGTKAEAFLAKAKSAVAKAEEALERVNRQC